MNPEHVSAEERPAPTSFLGISSFQYPLVSPSLAVSLAGFEEREELQRKQKIIGSALKRIITNTLRGVTRRRNWGDLWCPPSSSAYAQKLKRRRDLHTQVTKRLDKEKKKEK